MRLFRGLFGCVGAALLLASAVHAAPKQGAYRHEGVASCAGSTCHGRQEATGAVVRQNELISWQDESSPAGAHSRAWRVLLQPRSQKIAARLGLGAAQNAPECLGCHADFVAPAQRGPRFDLSDGVGCEGCHGGSGAWLASHYAVGATHAQNVARGLTDLTDPKTRAGTCLDCHFGGNRGFVTHRMMAAGHPRVSFELDLFTALQRHHDEDGDYVRRKRIPGGVRTWAVGQAMALERALTLYQGPKGSDGAFPEFYFLDCRTCHRSFSDDPDWTPTRGTVAVRPLPAGFPTFNDENLIMLQAAARVAAPALAVKLERDSRGFHAAMAAGRPAAVAAASRLAATARELSGAFAGASFSRTQTVAILNQVLGGSYSDYQGGAQAVMAADTLLNAMVAARQADRKAVIALRPELDRAYRAVRDANGYRPAELAQAFARVSAAVGKLK